VPSGARPHAKENINMNSIMVAPARAPHQRKATDLVAAGIVGNTPTLGIGDALHHTGSGPDYSATLEGDNPGGLNDRAGLDMVRHARDRGDLHPGGRIVESGSGILSLGLAVAGTVYDHPVTIVTDPGMESLLVHLLSAQGADVDMVDAPHPVGGWQQARHERVQQLLAADVHAWCPDQYANPATMLTAARHTGRLSPDRPAVTAAPLQGQECDQRG
jgi:S-sulfo-L-cysteine synthase (3-phospho-L-serine-dependent)